MGEFGQVVSQGDANAARLIAVVGDPDSGLPADAIVILEVLIAALQPFEEEIRKLDTEIFRRARGNGDARQQVTMLGNDP